MVAAAREAGFAEAGSAESAEAALAALVEADPGPSRLLICGSLYFAGEVLKRNG
jgi:dihydrofolate synthase/folylpolyglutamate synthase